MSTTEEDRTKADSSTEEKIKQAARKLFTKMGYADVKTRDIAAEAGINLALLNYYFRSKEKLFEIIRLENLQQFVQGIDTMLSGENNTIEEVTDKLISKYIDWLNTDPEPSFFVLNELRKDPAKLDAQIDALIPGRSEIRKRIFGMMKAENMTMDDIFQLTSNMIGLIMAPFIVKHLLQSFNDMSQEQFDKFMEDRKRLIPLWLKAMKDIK